MSYFADLPMWANAMIGTFVVSLLPNVLLVLMPESMLQNGGKLAKSNRSVNLGKMLLMFAVAGLLGDVFLHTLPHMLAPHHHHHAQVENTEVGQIMLKSVYKEPRLGTCDINSDPHTCKFENEVHHHQPDEHDHSNHEHHVGEEEEDHHDHHHHINDEHVDHDHHDDKHADEDENHHHDHHEEHHHDGHNHSDPKPLLEKEVWAPLLLLIGFLAFFLAEKAANTFLSTNRSHDHKHHDHSKLKAAGWLNLIADSLHNFTDGITIGAAFASGRGLGLAAFLSVLIHEIPHEISDFIILIRSGMTKWQAISAQFVTALAAFLGTALGLYLSENNETVQTVLLAITGGGFVYIATVNVMPQIVAVEYTENESLGLLQVIGEVLCFALGVGLMITVAQLEEHEH